MRVMAPPGVPWNLCTSSHFSTSTKQVLGVQNPPHHDSGSTEVAAWNGKKSTWRRGKF